MKRASRSRGPILSISARSGFCFDAHPRPCSPPEGGCARIDPSQIGRWRALREGLDALRAVARRLSATDTDTSPFRGATPELVRASNTRMGTATSTECRASPGGFAPVVDRAKCEGKAECVEVCPFQVFDVRRIDDADFAQLGLLAKLKSIAHGRKTAYTPRSSACQACGKCVAACPERAIRLARTGP